METEAATSGVESWGVMFQREWSKGWRLHYGAMIHEMQEARGKGPAVDSFWDRCLDVCRGLNDHDRAALAHSYVEGLLTEGEDGLAAVEIELDENHPWCCDECNTQLEGTLREMLQPGNYLECRRCADLNETDGDSHARMHAPGVV